MTKAKLAAKALRRKRTKRVHNKAQAGKLMFFQGNQLTSGNRVYSQGKRLIG